MKISFSDAQPVPASWVILPVSESFSTEKPASASLPAYLPQWPASPLFTGDTRQQLAFSGADSTGGVLLGIGKTDHPSRLENALRHFFFTQKGKLPTEAMVDLRYLEAEIADDWAAWVEAAWIGLSLSAYDPGQFKTEAGSPKRNISLPESIVLVQGKGVPPALPKRAEVLAKAIARQLHTIDSPPNYFTPAHFGEWARFLGTLPDTTATVFGKEALQKLGFGALLGVNQGSTEPPTFSIVDYAPAGATHTLALVGKGVTFDTGGISLKPSDNMHFMKSDLGGGATAMAAVQAAIDLRLPLRVIAAVPSTDNMPDGNAFVPGNILTAYGGITIEVMDTDAEGRLILADALSYVTETYAPDTVIDMATLTGACVVSLGYEAAGLFTANDALAQSLAAAGEASRERVWRLPLWDSYASQLDSDVADIKNLGTRVGGAITAAKFLEKFTRNHPNWAHLDIAGVAFGDTPYTKMKAASGWGVRMLVRWMEQTSGR